MLVKKYLLLLSSVPMFSCYLLIKSFFNEAVFSWNDIICFSVFIVSVTALLAINNAVLKIISVITLHGSLIVLFSFNLFELTETYLLTYCIFSLPFVLFIALLSWEKKSLPTKGTHKTNVKKNEKKKSKQEEKNKAFTIRLTLCLFFFALTVYVLTYLSHNSPALRIDLDGTSMIFVLLFFAILFMIFVVYKRKAKTTGSIVFFLIMLCLFTLLEGSAYTVFFNGNSNGTVQWIFPSFFSLVVLFDFYGLNKAIENKTI